MHPRPETTPTVDAPCVRNCCLNEQDVCMGCGRMLPEILQWQGLTVAQREQVLIEAEKRRAANQHRSFFSFNKSR